jgi:hypothetical protein
MNALDWRKPDPLPPAREEVMLLTGMHGVCQGHYEPADGQESADNRPFLVLCDMLAVLPPSDLLAWAPMPDLPAFLEPITLTGIVPAAEGQVRIVPDMPSDSPVDDAQSGEGP